MITIVVDVSVSCQPVRLARAGALAQGWRFAVRDSRLGRLETGSWKLEAGSWKLIEADVWQNREETFSAQFFRSV
jgi:hypothetical protein